MFLLFWKKKKKEFVSIWREGLLNKRCRRQSADLVKSIYVNTKCSENILRLKRDTVWSQLSANSARRHSLRLLSCWCCYVSYASSDL